MVCIRTFQPVLYLLHYFQSWTRNPITSGAKQTQKKKRVLSSSRIIVKEETSGECGELNLRNGTQSSSHGLSAAKSLSLVPAEPCLQLPAVLWSLLLDRESKGVLPSRSEKDPQGATWTFRHKGKVKHYNITQQILTTRKKGLFRIVKANTIWEQLSLMNSQACDEMRINLINIISQIYLQKYKEVLSQIANTVYCVEE